LRWLPGTILETRSITPAQSPTGVHGCYKMPIARFLGRNIAMRLLLFAVTFLGCLSPVRAADKPAGIPADYSLQYTQDFSKPESLKDFQFTDETIWKHSVTGGKNALELTSNKANYQPKYRSPFLIALLKDKQFEDVIIEADCLQTGKEYGHRDMVFVYGYQSPTKFYYTHIATKGDDHAHNCFIVNEAPRLKFGKEVTAGAQWGLDVWHHVRVERKASDGSVRVFFDDMTKPIMQASDKTFGTGAVGFGSFDETGKIANIRIWSANMEKKETPAFPKMKGK
jgi:hypothetical protein